MLLHLIPGEVIQLTSDASDKGYAWFFSSKEILDSWAAHFKDSQLSWHANRIESFVLLQDLQHLSRENLGRQDSQWSQKETEFSCWRLRSYPLCKGWR